LFGYEAKFSVNDKAALTASQPRAKAINARRSNHTPVLLRGGFHVGWLFWFLTVQQSRTGAIQTKERAG
jgi:hypothetical protein